ncbi:hypothetical protein [Streptomyces sp. NPDC001068]|uniref:hypothetical protein n=1 Tax=Streptomyces sp. NPDC001068 TaxID=3364544 RepID=UPI0036C99108
MPTRTMLPPHLTRHYYETQRRLLLEEGMDTKPWYRLTPAERASVEQQVEILRQAIRAAEEEQDLVAQYNAPPAADIPAAEDSPAPEPCDCMGCTMRATFTELLKEAYKPLGWTVSEPSGPLEPFSVNVVPLDTRRWGVPLTREEEARLAAATDEAFGKLTLITAGIDFAVLTGPAPMGPITFGPADPKPQDAALRAAAEAAIRKWEAEGRPLKLIYPPEPIKFQKTPGANWIDTAALEKDLRRRYGSPFEAMRREYWAQWRIAPQSPLRGVTDFLG